MISSMKGERGTRREVSYSWWWDLRRDNRTTFARPTNAPLFKFYVP